MYISLYLCIYISSTYTRFHVLKVKSTIIRYVKRFKTGVSTSKNLLKEIESVNKNALGRITRIEKILVGLDEMYSQSKMFKVHYIITNYIILVESLGLKKY